MFGSNRKHGLVKDKITRVPLLTLKKSSPYQLSYNEIIRSGVKFYVGLTLAKELIGDSLELKDITIGGKNLGEILNSPQYQQNFEQKISKIAKILIWEFFEKGMDFKEKTKSIRKERKVGRPKTKNNQ